MIKKNSLKKHLEVDKFNWRESLEITWKSVLNSQSLFKIIKGFKKIRSVL